VALGCVLDDHEAFALHSGITELSDRAGPISEEASLVFGVDPRTSDDPRAVARTNLVLIGIDQGVECSLIDEPLLDKQRFERHYAQSWVAVKAYWHLTVTAAEKSALQSMLGTCT